MITNSPPVVTKLLNPDALAQSGAISYGFKKPFTWVIITICLYFGALSASASDAAEVAITDAVWQTQLSQGLPTDTATASWITQTLPYKLYNGQWDSMWLQKEVDIPINAGRKYILRFSGLQRDAIVFVKSDSDVFERVGEVKSPEGKIDITDAIVPGQRATIRIWVTRWWIGLENSSEATDYFRKAQLNAFINNKGYTVDSFRTTLPLGISEDISLVMMTAEASIDNVIVQTTYRSDPKTLTLTIDGEKREMTENLRLRIQVTELDGTPDGLPAGIFMFTGGSQSLDFEWENPRLWELGAGYLYCARIDIINENGDVIYQHPDIRFGFREIWRDGKDMYLNGHLLRLRIAPFAQGGVPSMMFYQGIGFNTLLMQPHSDFWWGAASQNMFPSPGTEQYCSKEMLDYADEQGWAVLMCAPSVDSIGEQLFRNEPVAEQYKMYFTMWFTKNDHQNRPSIFSWTTSMNSWGSVMDPMQIGKLPGAVNAGTPNPYWKAMTKEKGDSIIRGMDPTRFLYSHHGGITDLKNGLTDIETIDLYTNFMPIQEVEEYLSHWSEQGERPWGVCEFGLGYPIDFFNNGRLLPQFTEFLAQYYGDSAYAAQTGEYINECLLTLKKPVENYINTKFIGQGDFKSRRVFEHLHKWSLFGKYNDDYTTRVLRSWRTYGLNYGVFPFNMPVGFGAAPGYNPNVGLGYTYRELGSYPQPESLLERPSWANLYYDQFKGVSQPLLVYIGGENENFAEKGHNFESGENVKKSIIAIWDGPYGKSIDVEWEVKSTSQSAIGAGSVHLELEAGDIVKTPFTFTVPALSEKTDGEIIIRVYDEQDTLVSSDSFTLTFFPRDTSVPSLEMNWRIYDPVGDTVAELEKMGLTLNAVSKGESLADTNVLIVGADCIQSKEDVIYSEEDIEGGLKVLIMEQNTGGLESLGFRTEDNIPRNVFPRSARVLEGITDEDLRDWRGSGTLLPETSEGLRARDVKRAPHWKNTGSVASVTIETPQMGAFTPLAEAGFDMQYSALLSWKHGQGEILFSQLDINGRIGKEPAAKAVMRKIIGYLDNTMAEGQSKRLVYLGSSSGDYEYINALGFTTKLFASYESLDKTEDILVVGDPPDNADGIMVFANQGGDVLVLPQAVKTLGDPALFDGVEWENKTIFSVKPENIENNTLLHGIGPQLLNFRIFMDAMILKNGLLDGFVLQKPCADGGRIIYSQLDWRLLAKGARTTAEVHNVYQPKLNAYRFYRQLFTNLGAETNQQVAGNLFD